MGNQRKKLICSLCASYVPQLSVTNWKRKTAEKLMFGTLNVFPCLTFFLFSGIQLF